MITFLKFQAQIELLIFIAPKDSNATTPRIANMQSLHTKTRLRSFTGLIARNLCEEFSEDFYDIQTKIDDLGDNDVNVVSLSQKVGDSLRKIISPISSRSIELFASYLSTDQVLSYIDDIASTTVNMLLALKCNTLVSEVDFILRYQPIVDITRDFDSYDLQSSNNVLLSFMGVQKLNSVDLRTITSANLLSNFTRKVVRHSLICQFYPNLIDFTKEKLCKSGIRVLSNFDYTANIQWRDEIHPNPIGLVECSQQIYSDITS